ncbi:hypothetical protein [Nocardia aurea]|uniref:Uncharacterized protein n=1 Tax=Nocardia aurea TaxID=2144174 RepID=A0ABV3G233_9NOCA
MGSAGTGSAAVGSAATGSALTGSAAVGSATPLLLLLIPLPTPSIPPVPLAIPPVQIPALPQPVSALPVVALPAPAEIPPDPPQPPAPPASSIRIPAGLDPDVRPTSSADGLPTPNILSVVGGLLALGLAGVGSGAVSFQGAAAAQARVDAARAEFFGPRS